MTWLPGAAARSGHELDLFEAQMVTALRDKRGDHGLLVALCAREHRRLPAAVIVAPLPQTDERDMKVAALSGQVVLVPRRPFLIANPLEDSFVDQPAKTLSENLPRDPEVSLELVESSQSEQSVPDDQQRPSLADHLEGACDRTVLAFVGALEHAFQDSGQSCEVTDGLVWSVPSRNRRGSEGAKRHEARRGWSLRWSRGLADGRGGRSQTG